MSDRMQAVKDDLAFMREVSSGGAAASARKGGVILTAGGVIFAAASVAVWAGVQGRLPVAALGWVWLAAMALFLLVLGVTLARGGEAPGVRDRATGIAWAAVGSVIFTTVIGCQVAGRMLNTPAISAIIPTVVLALYGAGWTVASHMSRRRWMTAVALGGHVGAVVMAFLAASPALFLAYAAALLLLGAAPGLVLLRRRD